MLDTALCYLTGFAAVLFGGKANNHCRQSQQNQVDAATTKRKSAAWGINE